MSTLTAEWQWIWEHTDQSQVWVEMTGASKARTRNLPGKRGERREPGWTQYVSQDMRKAQSRTCKRKRQPEIICVNRKKVASFTSRNFESTFHYKISKQIFINVNKLYCYITLSLLVNKSSFYFNHFINVIFFPFYW